MKKITTIISAYFKLLLVKTFGLPEEIKLEAERRLLICDTCPLKTNNWCDAKKCVNVKKAYKTEHRLIDYVYYNKVCGCGCYLPAKKFVEDKNLCPLKKW